MFRRLRIPPGPILGAVMMSGLAFTLVVVIIYRSPYTHGNLSAEGYNRTEVIHVGEEQSFAGLGLRDSASVLNGDPEHDGRILFFAFGCASCHGLDASGGPVGKDIRDASANRMTRQVRRGPGNMPAFAEDVLSDSELQALIAFIASLDN